MSEDFGFDGGAFDGSGIEFQDYIQHVPVFLIGPAPAVTSEFAISALTGFAPVPDDFPGYMQFKCNSVALGADDVRIVDFVGPAQCATRGTGENSHVITVRIVGPR